MGGFGSGRPAKPEHLRRSHHRSVFAGVAQRLPRSGRVGPVPDWPLPTHPDPKAAREERRKWRREWRRPQALMWEMQGVEELVARYVRLSVEWDRTGSWRALDQSNRLAAQVGLTSLSMARLRWEIVDDTPEESEGEKVVSIRERLKAIDAE